MSGRQAATFQEALEIVESLPQEQQENLINIIRRRLIECKREALAGQIKEAREEYKRKEVRRGTINDFIREITE